MPLGHEGERGTSPATSCTELEAAERKRRRARETLSRDAVPLYAAGVSRPVTPRIRTDQMRKKLIFHIARPAAVHARFIPGRKDLTSGSMSTLPQRSCFREIPTAAKVA